MVKDHLPSLQGWKEFLQHCNAESQKQGEGPRWEGRKTRGKHVGDVQAGHGIWEKLLVVGALKCVIKEGWSALRTRF